MKKKKVSEKENEWKGILQDKDNQTYFYQVGESNVTPDSFTTTYTNGSDYDFDKDYCNVGVNKDWDFTKEELNKFYHDNWVKENINYKEKRIDFEFTPLTFWQLTPSIAINLSMKEIEFVWLCFGMYVNFKRNGNI